MRSPWSKTNRDSNRTPRAGHAALARRVMPTRQVATLLDLPVEVRLIDALESVGRLCEILAGRVRSAEVTQEMDDRRPWKFPRSGLRERPLALLPSDRELRDDPPIEEAEISFVSLVDRPIPPPRLAVDRGRPPLAPPRRQIKIRRIILVPLLALAWGLGCWLLGDWFGGSHAAPGMIQGKPPVATSRRGSDPEAAKKAAEQVLLATSEALRAEHTGDLATARRLYETPIHHGASLPGASYRLALLAMARHDLPDCLLNLDRSVAAGENVAPCLYIQAMFAGFEGDYATASDHLQAATRAEPMSAHYLFCLAEALRRGGKTLEAVAAFQHALDRPYSPAEGRLIVFKLRLAEIEYSRDATFNAALAKHLGQEPIPGDWLLLGAAQDLADGFYASAAGKLQRASDLLGQSVYDDWVRDYFFQEYAHQPEVAALLEGSPVIADDEPKPSVTDIATQPLEDADPAVWWSQTTAAR